LILLLCHNRFILSGGATAVPKTRQSEILKTVVLGIVYTMIPFFGVIVRLSLDSASIVRSFGLDHWHISKPMLYKLCKLRLHSR
jgi:hypothetical protein